MIVGKRVLSFLSVRREPGWMAVLPFGDRIALAHVVRGAGVRPEIRMLDSFALESGEVDALRRLRSARHLKSYACTTLMAAGEYHLSQIDAPDVPLAERKEAVRWALKGMVDYPVDRACIDVLDIPMDGAAAGRRAGIFAVSAPEDAVQARARAFAEAKVPLAAIDIPELAQRNIAALFEDENRGLAFLRLDASGGLLTLTFHGELIAARRVEVSATQLVDSDAGHRAQAMERLVLDLQRSLDNFDRQYSHIPISKLVAAAYPPVAELASALAENLYVPVVPMDLALVLDFPAVPELREPASQAMNLLLIGAALRTDGGAA
jgi:MSHA biogenesis protein MshI